ncbi:hypothetical protein OAJ67_01490 [Candidatus Nitrosopelagicus sp.]|nr:hypothetical protein [Candidatus Nitrosopelagicus sp.]
MTYQEILAQTIDEWIETNPDKVKLDDDDVCAKSFLVTLRGERKQYSTIKLPINLVYHNVSNGRYLDDYLELKKTMDPDRNPEDWDLDSTLDTDAKLIREMLRNVDPKSFARVLRKIQNNGQEQPGIISHDGTLVNANRRLAILHELAKQDPEKYGFIRVVRLPKEIDGSEIDSTELFDIEVECQMEKEDKLDYTPNNEILKIMQGKKRGLSHDHIAKKMDLETDHVDHQVIYYGYMEECLEQNGWEGEFKRLDGKYAYFVDLHTYILSENALADIDPLDVMEAKRLIFKLMFHKKFHHKDIRKIPAMLAEKRIAESLLDGAKINEETGEEFDVDSIWEHWDRAVYQQNVIEISQKPEKLINSIKFSFEKLKEILEKNEADDLLQKPKNLKSIGDILSTSKLLEEFWNKHQDEDTDSDD